MVEVLSTIGAAQTKSLLSKSQKSSKDSLNLRRNDLAYIYLKN